MLSERINEFIEDIDENFSILRQRQEQFQKAQKELVEFKLIKSHIKIESLQLFIESFSIILDKLFPRGTNHTLWIQLGNWMINLLTQHLNTMKLANLRLDSDKRLEHPYQPWQQLIKKRYEELFFSKRSAELKDSNKHEGLDELSKSIYKIYEDNVETVERVQQKFDIWSEFETVIKKDLKCQTMVFGSTFTLCGTKKSDLDIIVYISSELAHKIILEQVQSILHLSDTIPENSIIVLFKKIPLLSMQNVLY